MGRNRNRREKSRAGQSHKDADEDRLYEILPKAGLSVCQVESDGNCLFRAFASQYCGDEERHSEFRQGCCEYMEKDEPDFFTSFLEERSLSNYVSEMRHDGAWGTQMQIVALCKRYNVDCVIFRPDGLHYRIECDLTDERDARILMLSHHDEEHFNEVRFVEKSRVLTSFEELELLLTELEDRPVVLSKKDARRASRKGKSTPRVSLDQQRVFDV